MSWLRENALNEKKWVLVSSQQLKENKGTSKKEE